MWGPVDDFEKMVNDLSDKDREWWPFVALRPERDQPMKNRVVFVLAALYGAMFGVLFNILGAALGVEVAVAQPYLPPLILSMVLFVAYKYSFAWAWNRRAQRIAARTRDRLPAS